MSYHETKRLLDQVASIDRSKRKLLANTIRDILAQERPDLTIKPHMVGKKATENASFESAVAAMARAGGINTQAFLSAIDQVAGKDLDLLPDEYKQIIEGARQTLSRQAAERDRINELYTTIREPESPPNVRLSESAGVRTGYPNYAEIDNVRVPIDLAITSYSRPAPPVKQTFTDMTTGAVIPIRPVEVRDITTVTNEIPDPWQTPVSASQTSYITVSPVLRTPEVRALSPASVVEAPVVNSVINDVIQAATAAKPSPLADEIFQREIANRAGYFETSANRPFSGTELDDALSRSRVAAELAGRAPIDMAGAFNRYGNLPAAQFADKIRALAAIENPEDVPVYRDAVSDRMDRQLAAERGRFDAPVRGDTVIDKIRFLNQVNSSASAPAPAPDPVPVYRDAVSDRMDRQLAAERGRFNAPVRGDTVADKVRFLNQINNSVPEPPAPAPPPPPPRQPVVDSMPTTPRGPRLESGFDFKEYYRPPGKGLSGMGLGIASAAVAPVLLAQAYKYLKGEE